MKTRMLGIVLAWLVVLSLVSPTISLFYPVSAQQTVQLDGYAISWDVVNLTWTPVENVNGYEIYRSTSMENLVSLQNLLVYVNWSSYPKYEPGKEYNQGDIVEYNGKLYKAKYWTTSPPSDDPYGSWEYLGEAEPTTNYLDQFRLKPETTYYYAVVPVFKDGSRGEPSNIIRITTPKEPFRVVVYYISWGIYARKFFPEDIPFEKVTHVNYAFLNPKEDGTVDFYDTWADPQNLEKFKELKKKYPQVKILISVGGWTLSKYFSVIAADPAKRERFARTALEIIRKYNLDGLDIDWEYPGGGGMEGNYVSPDDGKNFVLLVKTVREIFDQAELEDKKRVSPNCSSSS
ncbi:chitinase [Pyrococcus furiosus DSM 3638]|uniref:Chitinase n=3 Tax=Pyrococcus furiosus TaxID=2261 RepID=Q8U1H4_PYRFU|nr:glycosyl hydrolase family 18 protein [Pyrococcus furiosus]AAL81358.1 putative chitinase [Pyrococcus furiosus DSM 3638]AFN04021.1 chitinase [Pyrococcus furiosus COM1]QEK78878.1 chitinase [Pyrococcus furiosus DSM 3638]